MSGLLASLGCLFGLYLVDVASDKRWAVTSVISSAVPFKIVLQKA